MLTNYIRRIHPQQHINFVNKKHCDKFYDIVRLP